MTSNQAQWDKETVQLHVTKRWHFEMESLITSILMMLIATTVIAIGKL